MGKGKGSEYFLNTLYIDGPRNGIEAKSGMLAAPKDCNFESLLQNSYWFKSIPCSQASTQTSSLFTTLTLYWTMPALCGVQLEMLERKSGEEAERLRREVERSRQETHRLTREADIARLQAGEEAKQELQKLNKQLEESHRRHETQVRVFFSDCLHFFLNNLTNMAQIIIFLQMCKFYCGSLYLFPLVAAVDCHPRH